MKDFFKHLPDENGIHHHSGKDDLPPVNEHTHYYQIKVNFIPEHPEMVDQLQQEILKGLSPDKHLVKDLIVSPAFLKKGDMRQIFLEKNS